MRSMIASASFISSIDSSRTFSARRWYPQLSHILAWMKYWLIAVSSAVSTSFSISMMSGSPRMAGNVVPSSAGGRGSGGDRLEPELGEQLVDHLVAAAAAGAGAAALGEGVGVDRAGLDLGPDRSVVHGLAVAHHHDIKCA